MLFVAPVRDTRRRVPSAPMRPAPSCHSNCGDLGRVPLQKFEQPRAARAVPLCISDHRKTADDEKPSQAVVSTLRYLPERLLAAA